MYLWMVPSSSMLRVMLSSQRHCPRSWRVWVAFIAFLPLPVLRCLGLLLVLAGRGQAITCELRYPVRGEAELVEQLLQRCRSPEGVHPDHGAAVTDVAVPAQGRCLLHRDARSHRRRQDLVAVLLRLAVEEFPAGHADHAGAYAAGLQLLPGSQR